MEITCSHRDNVTMLTFAVSMTADRVLWCRKTGGQDLQNAEIEFRNTVKLLRQAATTEEMDRRFMLGSEDAPAASMDSLCRLKDAYLK